MTTDQQLWDILEHVETVAAKYHQAAYEMIEIVNACRSEDGDGYLKEEDLTEKEYADIFCETYKLQIIRRRSASCPRA